MRGATSPILIAGPTASGKSALALAVAEHVGGTIINADSMQMYRELRILTARPTPEDEARVPHAMYGFVPASEAYSAGRFVKDAAAAIDTARAEGRRPILVGGTGLYFKALLEGLSPVPEIDPGVRAHWRQMAADHGAYALWQMLTDSDPEMAFQLDPNDSQRIVRSHEVMAATGKSLAYWWRVPGVPVVDPENAVKLAVMPERTELHARADARFERMMVQGALAEAAAFAELNLDPTLPAMRAIGVGPLIATVRGQTPLDQAVIQAKAETRQYIKRQSTWFNGNIIAWKIITSQQIESNIEDIFSFIKS